MANFPQHPDLAPSNTESNTSLDSQNLCIECGICCLGLFFSRVKVSEEEAKSLDSQPLTHRKEKKYLAFPCTAFKGGCCSIYENRPQKCGNYDCLSFRRVRQGKVSYQEALHNINITIEQSIWILQQLKDIQFIETEEEIQWPPKSINLRDTLGKYYYHIKKRIKNEGPPSISQQERELCFAIFDFYKGLNLYFRNSDLLDKYGNIILHFKETVQD